MLVAQTKVAAPPVAPAAQPASFDAFWRQTVEPIELFLEQVAEQLEKQVAEFDAEIVPFAQYVLCNQGKQLRPALVGLSAAASGQVQPAHVTAAVIIEMVHLATLVHDDVMDEAEIRRRRPTAAANWGNEISVLLGDCLFANALRLAASFPTPEICRAVSSATNTVCSGEILQTLRRGNLELAQEEYLRILEKKTGELFALSCDLGAFLNQARPGERFALHRYGMAFGTAYQIYDDCLDVFGTESRAGKSLGSDLAKGKLTLPVLAFLERAGEEDRDRLLEWLEDWEPRLLADTVELLQRHDALSASQAVIHRLLSAARRHLERLAPTDGRLSLSAMTDFLEQQTRLLGVFSGGPSQG